MSETRTILAGCFKVDGKRVSGVLELREADLLRGVEAVELEPRTTTKLTAIYGAGIVDSSGMIRTRE